MLTVSERGIIVGSLVFATLAAWAGTWAIMAGMHHMEPAGAEPQSIAGVAVIFLMWIAMMVAMMLPSAAPMVSAFATIAKRRRQRRDPYVPTLIFVAGYLAVWALFSVVITVAHWILADAGLLGSHMDLGNPTHSAVVLILAGLYQLTPVKEACLTYCRSPSAFILSEWRENYDGAMIMGFRHGLYCVGCCWALMALLFTVSMMDLRWATALAVYVAAEKILPGGQQIARALGIVAIVTGVSIIFWHIVRYLIF